jgi:hypothetical protein
MPYDTSRPDTGHWVGDHLAPGYTPGQRAVSFASRGLDFFAPGLHKVF